LVFLDESGYMLQPLRRRVWARRGHTPVQYASARHDRITALAALAKAPWAARFDLYCRLLDHNAHTDDVVQFLRQVHRHLRRPIILVCDRLQVHRAAAKCLQRQQGSWFTVEWLPPYAPDLDPVEYVWTQSKYGDLANFLPDDIDELRRAVARLIEQYRHDPERLRSFFQEAQLVY
jgi:putative transposase